MTGLTDEGALRRVGVKSVLSFLSVSAFAVVIGLSFATVFAPGMGVHLDELMKSTSEKAPVAAPYNLARLLGEVVPDNFLKALSNNDHMLQVVAISIFTALMIHAAGEGARIIREFCAAASKVIFRMIEAIMSLSPYAVFCLIAPTVSAQGLDILRYIAGLLLTVAFALTAQYLWFGLLVWGIGRMSPLPFYRKMIEVQSVAFSVRSCKATLPTAMRALGERMGVSASSTSFVLPLGVSMNMAGSAIYLGICSLFVAQAYGVHFRPEQYLVLVVMGTLGSIGGAGIPGGSVLMMGMVFASVGLPLGPIALILAIDPAVDMFRTIINITGGSMVTLLVDKSEGTLNESVYRAAI